MQLPVVKMMSCWLQGAKNKTKTKIIYFWEEIKNAIVFLPAPEVAYPSTSTLIENQDGDPFCESTFLSWFFNVGLERVRWKLAVGPCLAELRRALYVPYICECHIKSHTLLSIHLQAARKRLPRWAPDELRVSELCSDVRGTRREDEGLNTSTSGIQTYCGSDITHTYAFMYNMYAWLSLQNHTYSMQECMNMNARMHASGNITGEMPKTYYDMYCMGVA